MRHLTEVRDIPDLVYTDDYTIRAIDKTGSTLWTKRFPHMLMQTYYASNNSFIMIRNVHSVTAGDHSLTEGVNLLTMGTQPTENHVLLALLFSPTSHSSIPLLESAKPIEDPSGRSFIPLEDVGEVHGTSWPLVMKNATSFPYGRWDPPYSHDSRSVHHLTVVQQLVILLAAIGFGFMVFLVYKMVEYWYGSDEKLAELAQTGYGHAKMGAQLPPVGVLFPPTIPEENEEASSVSSASSASSVSCTDGLSVESTPSLAVSSSDCAHARTPDLSAFDSTHSTLSTLSTHGAGTTMGDTTGDTTGGTATVMTGTTMGDTTMTGASMASTDLTHLNHISLLGADLPLCTGRYRQDFKVTAQGDSHT